MQRWHKGLVFAGLGCGMAMSGWAQEDVRPALSDRPASDRKPLSQPRVDPAAKVSIPAGAQVLVTLQHAITTKSAKVGDPVYAITSFPYVQNERMLIPAGTYVQGRISAIRRPGRVKGRAELLFHFTTLIYPNGYTVMLPGAVDNVPGMEHSTMKDEEGTIQQDGQKAHDAGTIAETAATGGLIGAAAGAGKGAAIGGVGGAAVGTVIALLSHGNDLRLESGTSIQMVIQRPIDLDADRVTGGSGQGRLHRTERQ
jgi:type IV secretion system protein VirB10